MFGTNDNQAVMGSTTVQNPSMLDNVSSQDFQSTDNTAQQSTPPAQMQSTQPTTPDPLQVALPTTHVMTTDNPFVQNPTAGPATDAPQSSSIPAPTFTTIPADDTQSPSGPVEPPAMPEAEAGDQSGYLAALSSDTTSAATPPVDQEKLADMKQEALSHLEPLADHIEGTPEERFKTTMMMIQANDNHQLLEKALEAARDIADDKARAQAMLDIINEINYFSQVTEN